MKLDTFYKGNGVAFMKIDVEGNEEKVLRGAKEILEKYHPKIFFEVNKKTFGDYSRAYEVYNDLLSPFGYKLFFAKNGTLPPIKDELARDDVRAMSSQNWFAKV